MDSLEPVVDEVVDQIDEDYPDKEHVENWTRRVVGGHDWLRSESKEEHLRVQQEGTAELPIELEPASEDDQPHIIQRKAKQAAIEWVKRRALRRIRREFFRGDSLRDF